MLPFIIRTPFQNVGSATMASLFLSLSMLSWASATSLDATRGTPDDIDQISELIIRDYLQHRMDTFGYRLPDTLALSIERENPSAELLNRLSDLDTKLIGIARSDEFVPKNAAALKRHRIDISRIRPRSDGSLEVSLTYTVSDFPHGFSGREYYLQDKDGVWEIAESIDFTP